MFIPLRLEFAGLLSYQGSAAAPVVVDFQALAEEGLFGIFGPTGAGKTAVLDAICIALFDESYRVKSEDDFINLKANEAFVRLSYRSLGVTWEVCRAWRRTKKGNLDPGDLTLTREGVSVLDADKKRGLKEKIKESLGDLTIDQFKLAVIIPQNEFADFLRSTPKKRSDLLNELLNLNQYTYTAALSRLKAEAKEALDKATGNLEQLTDATPENLVEREVAHQTACQELADAQQALTAAETAMEAHKRAKGLYTEWQLAADERTRLEKMAPDIAALQRQMAEEEAAQRLEADANTRHEKQAATENAKREFAAAHTHAQAAETAFAQAEADAVSAKNALAEWINHHQPRLARLKEFHRTAQALQTERAALAQTQIQRIAAENAKNQFAIVVKTAAETVAQLRGDAQRLSTQQEELRQQKEANLTLARYAETGLNITRLETERKKLGTEYKAKKKQVDELTQECDSLQNTATPELAAQWQTHIENTEQYLAAIRAQLHVSDLAQQLQPGQPCPLCGNAHHPHPAAPAKELNESLLQYQIELDAARKQLAAMQNALARLPHLQKTRAVAEGELAQLKERGQHIRKQLDTALATLEGKDRQMIANADAEVKRIDIELQIIGTKLAAVQTRISEAEPHEKQSHENLKTAEQKATELVTLEASQQQRLDNWVAELVQAGIAPETDFAHETLALETQQTHLKDQETAAHNTQTIAATALALAQQAEKASHNQLHTTQAAYEAARVAFAQKATASVFGSGESALAYLFGSQRIELAEAGNQVSEYHKAQAVNTQSIARLEALLAATPFHSEAYEQARKSLEEAQLQNENAGVRKGGAENEWTALQKRVAERTQWEAERAKRQAHQDRVAELSRLLYGEGFRQFLITTKMQAVCQHANRYLDEFLHGRYSIISSYDGKFELRVCDRLNANTIRSVENLSGGETFLVALALALGLSALVQRGQPGFFFLDEGFGNLSPEHLDRVLDTLEALAQRTDNQLIIGLISHVEMVQERLATYPTCWVSPAKTGTEGSTLTFQ